MLVRSKAVHSRNGSAFRSRRVHLLHPANALPGKDPAQPPAANRGLGLLEWTGKLLPQGLLVTGASEAPSHQCTMGGQRQVSRLCCTLSSFAIAITAWLS